MATWLRKNTYVTTKGQGYANKAFAGEAELVITDIVSSDRWFTGDLPYDKNELDRPRQSAVTVRAFPASLESSKTAYIIECEFDSTQNRLNVDGMSLDEKNDEYFLRQIGVFAKAIENGVESPRFLLMWSECVRTEDVPPEKLDEIAGGADTVPAYSDDTPRVVLTYAFQLDNFEGFGDENTNVNIKVEANGAGVVTHPQLQSELDRRFTNPVVGSVKVGAKSKIVGQDYSGNIAKPLEVIEPSEIETGNKLRVDIPMVFYGDNSTYEHYYGRDCKLTTKVYIPEQCDYTVGVLYRTVNSNSDFWDILKNVVIQVDDTVATFTKQSDWKNYFDTSSITGTIIPELYSLRETFNLSVGWHTISVFNDVETSAEAGTIMQSLKMAGVSGISVRKGDKVNSLRATDFVYNISASQLCNNHLEVNQDGVEPWLWYNDKVLNTLTRVDDELKSYFPLVTLIDEYTTDGAVEKAVDKVNENTKSSIEELKNEVNGTLDEFKEAVDKDIKVATSGSKLQDFTAIGTSAIATHTGPYGKVGGATNLTMPATLYTPDKAVNGANLVLPLAVFRKQRDVIELNEYLEQYIDIPYDGVYTVGVLLYTEDYDSDNGTTTLLEEVPYSIEIEGEKVYSVTFKVGTEPVCNLPEINAHITEYKSTNITNSLVSYTLTLELKKGRCTMYMGFSGKRQVNTEEETVLTGIVSFAVGEGTDLGSSNKLTSISARQFCSGAIAKTLSSTVGKDNSWAFTNKSIRIATADDELRSYFPIIRTNYDYITAKEFGNMDKLKEQYNNSSITAVTALLGLKESVDDHNIRLEDVENICSDSFSTYHGFVTNDEPLPTNIGWYSFDETHFPSELDMPFKKYNLIKCGMLINFAFSDRVMQLIIHNETLYTRNAVIMSDNPPTMSVSEWKRVSQIPMGYSEMVMENEETSFDSVDVGKILVYALGNKMQPSTKTLDDFVLTSSYNSNQSKFNGYFKNGDSLSAVSYTAGRNRTGYWIIDSTHYPKDMPTVVLPDGSTYTPEFCYLHVENCNGGLNKEVRQSLIITGRNACTLVRYYITNQPLVTFTEWAVIMDSNNTTRTSLTYGESKLSGNEPTGTLQIVTKIPDSYSLDNVTSIRLSFEEFVPEPDDNGAIPMGQFYRITDGVIKYSWTTLDGPKSEEVPLSRFLKLPYVFSEIDGIIENQNYFIVIEDGVMKFVTDEAVDEDAEFIQLTPIVDGDRMSFAYPTPQIQKLSDIIYCTFKAFNNTGWWNYYTSDSYIIYTTHNSSGEQTTIDCTLAELWGSSGEYDLVELSKGSQSNPPKVEMVLTKDFELVIRAVDDYSTDVPTLKFDVSSVDANNFCEYIYS